MSSNTAGEISGRCSCGSVRYTLTRKPMFVHCCHCSWCQKESGSAFALNALIESDNISVLKGRFENFLLPSNSGHGQIVSRCASCHGVLWSHYGGARELVAFVRVGTLDDPAACPPDIHIYTSSKQPWVMLDAAVPAVEEYYQRSKYWPAESIARYRQVMGK